MDALDKLIEALGLPEETEEYGVKYNTKRYYDANPDKLAKLLARCMEEDYQEAVFMYLFDRNQELERKVEKIDELESREGDKDSIKIVNDETWQQIRDNFDIVVNGVVALAKIVENAQRVEQELLSYIEKLKNSRDDLTHNHIGNAMRGERTFISRELTKIVNKFQEEE